MPTGPTGWRSVAAQHGCPWAATPPTHALAVFHAAAVLQARGERTAAEAAYREGLSLDPDHQDALNGLAGLLQGQGRTGEAHALRRRIAEIEVERLGIAPEHRDEAVHFRLAQERRASVPPRVPPAYIEKQFDRYADKFDAHLVTALGYRGPDLLREALAEMPELLERAQTGFDTLDIGCGTGLCGVAFRPWSRRLDGVDQSPHMLDKARARGIYDNLAHGDLTVVLADRPKAYDLLIAADVLIYFGDLEPVFAAAAVAVRPSGLFLFTVERADAPDFFMNGAGRYSHAIGYLRATAAAAGFEDVMIREAIVRHEQNVPVDSYVGVLRKK